MRITFVTKSPRFAGGVRAIAVYAQRLKERGHDVQVISVPNAAWSMAKKSRYFLKHGKWPRTERSPPASFLDDTDVPHRTLDRFRPPTASDLPDADVIVATWWETAEWVAALPESKGAKVYFLQHFETAMPCAQEPGVAERVEATWQLPLHKIVVCGWLRQVAEERFGDFDTSLVTYGVDHDLFFAEPRTKQMAPTVGLMYSDAGFKGCDIAAEALRRARAVLPGLRAVAFGTISPDRGPGLPDWVEYRQSPPQDQLRDIYAMCDAWLFASRCEGFGLPVLEAMACRTPVIGTPTGVAPEAIEPGGGILVPMENASAMAEAIVSVAGMDASAWRKMSDAAYETASEYRWDEATERFEDALGRARGASTSGSVLSPLPDDA